MLNARLLHIMALLHRASISSFARGSLSKEFTTMAMERPRRDRQSRSPPVGGSRLRSSRRACAGQKALQERASANDIERKQFCMSLSTAAANNRGTLGTVVAAFPVVALHRRRLAARLPRTCRSSESFSPPLAFCSSAQWTVTAKTMRPCKHPTAFAP